jgi:hypothetical protein
MAKKIRVRSKRLDQLDPSKLSLALWLIARGVVEDKTTTATTPENANADVTTGEESE